MRKTIAATTMMRSRQEQKEIVLHSLTTFLSMTRTKTIRPAPTFTSLQRRAPLTMKIQRTTWLKPSALSTTRMKEISRRKENKTLGPTPFSHHLLILHLLLHLLHHFFSLPLPLPLPNKMFFLFGSRLRHLWRLLCHLVAAKATASINQR